MQKVNFHMLGTEQTATVSVFMILQCLTTLVVVRSCHVKVLTTGRILKGGVAIATRESIVR